MATIAQIFYGHARANSDRMAIWCDGETITYRALENLVNHWSCLMASRGVKRGDHIAVLLPNGIEFVALMLVAANLGVVLIPLNTSLPTRAICKAFESTKVKHVVGCSQRLEELISSGKNRDDSHGMVFRVVKGVWFSVDAECPGALFLNDRAATKASAEPGLDSCVLEDDPFILTMTSGSTGDPKPIVLTQRTKIERVQAAVEMYGITALDRTLAATPLYHSLAERLVLIPLLTGGTSILMTRFSPRDWLKCVCEHAVTFTIAVSSQLQQIAQHLDENDPEETSSLRCVVSSSALLDVRVKSELYAKLHCDFHECYGASEIAIATNLDPVAAQEKLESVGRAAPGVDIKILREDGQVAGTGEIGEIVCKTPMLFGGYFDRADLTDQSMWGAYFRTGDLGRIDEGGYLYLSGRKKDLIITGGINVYPTDIESVLLELSSIRECAAFPVPDDRLGEIVAVAVVPSQPNHFDQRAARIHCGKHLADFQQPRKYFLLDQLPKTELGKIIRHQLAHVTSNS